MTDLVLSILMLAGTVLTGAGLYAVIKRRDRKRGVLMIIAGLVMFGNVAITATPIPNVPLSERQ